MTRRDFLSCVAIIAVCIAGFTYLTLRPPTAADRVGADGVWRREAGR